MQAGGYQLTECDAEKKPCLYRFQKPTKEEFPHTLELFSRVPDGVNFVPPGHLTPIPMDEQVSSLSAILLDEDYYQFVLQGRRNKNGLPSWVGEDRLIPLKALAWMELRERVQQGEVMDSKKVNKHLADVVQLSALLQEGQTIDAPVRVKTDMERFVRIVSVMNQPEQMLALERIAAADGIRRN